MKKAGIMVVCAAVITASITAEGFWGTAFYIEGGIGTGMTWNGGDQGERIASVRAASPDYKKIPVYMDAAFGFSIFPPFMFGVLSFTAYSTMLADFSAWKENHVMLHNHLYASGIRFYPFFRGIQIGIDLGAARDYGTYHMPGKDGKERYGTGFGGKFSLAYDFDKTPGGSSACIGASLLYSRIGYNLFQGAVFIKYIFK